MLDPLTLDQLRVLVAVSETGSFSGAGRRLRRVQSAISQSVQSLETTLGVPLFDRSGKPYGLTDAGRVLLADARRVIEGAEALRARAESIAAQLEPELTLAVDSMFPNGVLIASLKALSQVFPCLPVTLFTEGLGAPEQRLRDGVARLAITVPRNGLPQDCDSEFLAEITMVPVVAADHPLAAVPPPLTRELLEPHVQLVLTDRSQVTAGFQGGIVSSRIWRFADLATRLDCLLAGFGWCNMPHHLVERHIESGALKSLDIDIGARWTLALHVVHQRRHPPGKAGRWLIEELRRHLAADSESDAASKTQGGAIESLMPPERRSMTRVNTGTR